MYARSMFIRQVLRGVVILMLRVTRVPLPVGYSLLKTDDTSIFKHQLSPPPALLAHSSLAPSSKRHIQYFKRTSIRTASEFGQAQTPVPPFFFCGSSSLAPFPYHHITIVCTIRYHHILSHVADQSLIGVNQVYTGSIRPFVFCIHHAKSIPSHRRTSWPLYMSNPRPVTGTTCLSTGGNEFFHGLICPVTGT